MTDGYDAIMRGILNKLRVMPEAGVAPLERTAKNSQALNLPNFNIEDTVADLAKRYNKAVKVESKRALCVEGLEIVESLRRSPKRLDNNTIEAKHRIASEAVEMGAHATSLKYGVPVRTVYRWIAQLRDLKRKLHIS